MIELPHLTEQYGVAPVADDLTSTVRPGTATGGGSTRTTRSERGVPVGTRGRRSRPWTEL